MAIKTIDKKENSVTFELNNGDFNALQKIIEKWGFSDDANALRFAIATLYITERGSLYQKKEDTSFVILEPVNDFVKK